MKLLIPEFFTRHFNRNLLFCCSFLLLFFSAVSLASSGDESLDLLAKSGGEQKLLNIALYQAVISDDVSKVREALENGAEVNSRFKKENTALMFAAKQNNRKMVQLLLDKGADQRLKNKNGQMAKDLAVEQGYKKILGLFHISIGDVPSGEIELLQGETNKHTSSGSFTIYSRQKAPAWLPGENGHIDWSIYIDKEDSIVALTEADELGFNLSVMGSSLNEKAVEVTYKVKVDGIVVLTTTITTDNSAELRELGEVRIPKSATVITLENDENHYIDYLELSKL